MRLDGRFFLREDVVAIARDLLGKVICSSIGDAVTCGIITETEAYAGTVDRASHAYGGRRTARTETMYREGGVAYIYLCYGVHHLFNFVTNKAGVPHAVLLRGIQPLRGIEAMERRRGMRFRSLDFTGGPGKVTRALGITTRMDGTGLSGPLIWVEDAGIEISADQVLTGPRIGVAYAGEDAFLPYRFRIASPEGIKKPPLE